ncbi:MAG TPA: hypothetical protein VM261_29295 [Kofleriaceae bacterium]|nr:hypothetical protein [Kofleriaceae bacterium]
MFVWIVGAAGLGAAFLARAFVRRTRIYKALFGAAHVVEVADALARMKRAALVQVDGEPPTSLDDGRLFVSSAGLAVAYTVRKHDGHFIHHVSVALAGTFTGFAVGGAYVLLAVDLFAWPLDAAVFEIPSSSVHHAEVVLDPAAHHAVADAPVARIGAGNAEARIEAALEARARVEWRRPAWGDQSPSS